MYSTRYACQVLKNLEFSRQIWSETFLILRRNERDMIKNVYRSSCIVSVMLVRF